MSEILNEDNDYRSSESGDDTVSLDFDRDDRLNRSRRDRSRSRSRSPRRRGGLGDDGNKETSAHIAALKAELAETKRRLAQLAGEDTAEAGTSGSSDLLIRKDKADQFFEWLSGEVSAEDMKRIRAYCLSPRFEGHKTPFVCPQLEIFYARELKGKKPFDLWEKDLKTIQNKFHEALRPLLFAWANLRDDGDEMLGQAIADSVKLWCQVNFNLTCLRRKNVLKATDAEYLDLLKSRSSFNIEEYDQLFGSTFRKTLVDLRKDEETRRKKPRPSTKGDANRGKSYSYRPSNGTNRGFALGGNKQQSNRLVPFENNVLPPVGGRLSLFPDEWNKFCQDRWILDVVSQGLALDFVSIPERNSPPQPVLMSAELDKAFDDEVISLLEKRAIKEIDFEDGFFWSSVFAIPKKTGGFRPIFNLRRLNYHIFYEHFQMESLDSLRHLIQAGDWFTKIDLKDAYLTVPVR